MEFDDVSAAGLVVQAVDVLGDERPQPAPRLQGGEGMVRRVGLHVGKLIPAGKGAGPVAGLLARARHKL